MPIHYRIHGILVLARDGNIYVPVQIFLSAADAVSSGSWFIVFNVLTLKVAILKVILPLNKFALCSTADY